MAKTVKFNDSPILLNKGTMYLDGVAIAQGITMQINAHISTWSGKTLNSGKTSSRNTGVTFDGVVTKRRTNRWAKGKIEQIVKNGSTPEFTIQGVLADKGSDYYKAFGSETVTAKGCVLTGDISLINFDANSDDVLTDTLNFNIYDVVFS